MADVLEGAESVLRDMAGRTTRIEQALSDFLGTDRSELAPPAQEFQELDLLRQTLEDLASLQKSLRGETELVQTQVSLDELSGSLKLGMLRAAILGKEAPHACEGDVELF